MPAACVFWAGYPEKERVMKGTVGDMGPKLAKEKERFFGLLFIGRFLEGQPYEKAMRWQEPQGKKKNRHKDFPWTKAGGRPAWAGRPSLAIHWRNIK